jgi:hypothetical protein
MLNDARSFGQSFAYLDPNAHWSNDGQTIISTQRRRCLDA